MGFYSGGLVIGRIFTSEIWEAYFREDLLSDGYFRLRFGGLISGRAYYRKDICVCDFRGLFSGGLGLIFGGAHYRNSTVPFTSILMRL